MKKEIPLLFSTVMVQAILEGRKTQTRRIVKFPLKSPTHHLSINDCESPPPVSLAKYKVGDMLWVRETMVKNDGFAYWPVADGYKKNTNLDKVVPSIHMPKSVARIWLEVTDVRVERLQDISEPDAIAEGVWLDKSVFPNLYTVFGMPHFRTAKECYRDLWEIINGRESWQANPFCWVVSFKVLSTVGKPEFTKEALAL